MYTLPVFFCFFVKFLSVTVSLIKVDKECIIDLQVNKKIQMSIFSGLGFVFLSPNLLKKLYIILDFSLITLNIIQYIILWPSLKR